MYRTLVLPADTEVIESGAFVGVAAEAIQLPAGVTQIATDAFDPDIVLIVKPGSYAESWAQANGFAWEN